MASSLSGPIPAHPMYRTRSAGGDFSARPVPRVRPEAQDIYTQHQGCVGRVLEVTGQSMSYAAPSSKYKPKAQPKDHVSANVSRMRQIQRQARKRQEETNKPVKAIWKSDKYNNVQSRVKQDLQENSKEKEAPPSRPSSATYLRAHSKTGHVPAPRPHSRSQSVEPPVEKLAIRPASATDVELKRRNVDFLAVNARAVRGASPTLKRAPSLTALDDLKKKKEEEEKKYQRGAVPNYLQKRKQAWKDEEETRIRNMPDPDLPPGHKVMPDAERRATLDQLKKSEKTLLQQLASLPIRNDTYRIRKHKDEIEKKLQEIDEAVKIFSRPKVFVKVDS